MAEPPADSPVTVVLLTRPFSRWAAMGVAPLLLGLAVGIVVAPVGVACIVALLALTALADGVWTSTRVTVSDDRIVLRGWLGDRPWPSTCSLPREGVSAEWTDGPRDFGMRWRGERSRHERILTLRGAGGPVIARAVRATAQEQERLSRLLHAAQEVPSEAPPDAVFWDEGLDGVELVVHRRPGRALAPWAFLVACAAWALSLAGLHVLAVVAVGTVALVGALAAEGLVQTRARFELTPHTLKISGWGLGGLPWHGSRVLPLHGTDVAVGPDVGAVGYTRVRFIRPDGDLDVGFVEGSERALDALATRIRAAQDAAARAHGDGEREVPEALRPPHLHRQTE